MSYVIISKKIFTLLIPAQLNYIPLIICHTNVISTIAVCSVISLLPDGMDIKVIVFQLSVVDSAKLINLN